MLVQCLRRWPNIDTTMGQCFALALKIWRRRRHSMPRPCLSVCLSVTSAGLSDHVMPQLTRLRHPLIRLIPGTLRDVHGHIPRDPGV